MQYVEDPTDGLKPTTTVSDVEYPQALRDMEDAPTLDTLRAGLEMQQQDMRMRWGSALERDWRMFACALPYLVAA
jgi:hypothetical protein